MNSSGVRRIKVVFAVAAVILLSFSIYSLINKSTKTTPSMLSGGMNIPYVSQLDYDEVVCVFGGTGRSVKSSGCGAACVSMVVSYLTDSDSPPPDELFAWAFENGYYNGDGLSHECLTDLAAQNGVSSEWIQNDEEIILEALYSYHPVIAHVGPGMFTNYGHYVVLRGVDEDGRIYVNDPSSLARSQTTYALADIIREARTQESFMICY